MKCKKKNCKYRAQFSNKMEYCDYITIKGEARRCAADKCDKYEAKTKERRVSCYGSKEVKNG